MASNDAAKWLKERISCCVCFKIFDKPHTFPCLHTLCKGCVNDLHPVKRGQATGYECPTCREFCDVSSVRHNFLINELLELYQMITTTGVPSKCKQCKTAASTHRCVECKSDFCAKCKTLHDGFPLMASHHSIDLGDLGDKEIVIDKLVFCSKHKSKLIELNCLPCEKPLCVICKAVDHDGHKCEEVEEALKRIVPDIKEKRNEIIENIKFAKQRAVDIKEHADRSENYINALEKEVKDTHKRIREKLDTDLAGLLAEIQTVRQTLEDQSKACERQIKQHVTDSEHVTSWVDTALSTAQGTSLLHELQSGVKARLEVMSRDVREKQTLLPSVKSIDASACLTELQAVHHAQTNIIGTLHVHQRDKNSGRWLFELQTLCKEKPKLVTSVKIEAVFDHHFAVINREVWLPSWRDKKARVLIYAENGTLQRELLLPQTVQQPRAIVQSRPYTSASQQTEVAIIASRSGVYSISSVGHVLQTLASGSFSDICIHEGTLYALERDSRKVWVFHSVSGTWQHVSDIQTTYATNTRYTLHDSLHVCMGHLFVYSYGVDKLYKYSMDGRQVGVYGEEKRGGRAGQLYGGKLCGCDSTGALLVCDAINESVQVRSADNQWTITALDDLGYDPHYAVPVDSTSFWTLGDDKVVRLYKLASVKKPRRR